MKGSKCAIIGVGQFGSAIARKLAGKGAEVYAFDVDEEKIENIKDEVALAVILDATDKKALKSQNIQELDAVIVAIGENFEAVILASVNLVELNVKRVISRASGKHQKMILEKLGVSEILTPEDEVAAVVAERLMNPSIISFLELPDSYEIAELKSPQAVINRTVEEVGLRDKYKLTLITIKREFEELKNGETVIEQHILGVPSSETVIYETDTIVVFGTTDHIERFIELNQ